MSESTQFDQFMPGLKPVLELLQDNPEKIVKVLYKRNSHNSDLNYIINLCHKNGIPADAVGGKELDDLCRENKAGYTSHQGVVAYLTAANLISLPDLLKKLDSSPLPLILALDQIKDTGNIGAICRTAWALGCAGILLPRHNSAALGPAAYRASAGALAQLPVNISTNLARALDIADEDGIAIIGAAKQTSDSKQNNLLFHNAFHYNWALPAILCLGNEARGLRPGVAKRCSCFLSIPFQREFDSLNIAQAGAILMGLCSAQYFSN